MILEDRLIEINSHTRNREYYIEKGYEEKNNKFYVKPSDLLRYSGAQETRICDVCGQEFTRRHEHHITTNERFGLDICGDCVKLPKYKKIKRKKTETTNLKKYGYVSPAQSKEVVEKIHETWKDRYGGHPLHIEEIKQRYLKTVNEKYGGNSPFCSEEIREKSRETMMKNSVVPTSSQQKKIFKLLQKLYPNSMCVLNYSLSKINLDIFIKINDVMIDIEYDGKHWHDTEEKRKYDRRRDEFVKSQGYKVLRIKSKRTVPEKEELKSIIDQMIKSNKKYYELILSDWN